MSFRPGNSKVPGWYLYEFDKSGNRIWTVGQLIEIIEKDKYPRLILMAGNGGSGSDYHSDFGKVVAHQPLAECGGDISRRVVINQVARAWMFEYGGWHNDLATVTSLAEDARALALECGHPDLARFVPGYSTVDFLSDETIVKGGVLIRGLQPHGGETFCVRLFVLDDVIVGTAQGPDVERYTRWPWGIPDRGSSLASFKEWFDMQDEQLGIYYGDDAPPVPLEIFTDDEWVACLDWATILSAMDVPCTTPST